MKGGLSTVDWRTDWERMRDIPTVQMAINSGLPAWFRLALRRTLTPQTREWFTLKVEP